MTDMPESQAGPSAQALVTDTVEETVTETPSDVPAVFVEGQMEVDGESDRPGAAGGEQDEANAAATTGVPPIPPASDVFAGIPAAESNTATSSTLAPVQPFQPSSSAPLGHEASTSTVSLSDRSNQAPTPMLGRQRAYRTGYIYDIMMMLHCQEGYTPTEDTVVDAGDGHPEEPMRIKRIFTRLKEAGLIARMKKLEFEEVTQAQAVQVHTEEHWEKVEGTRDMTDESIEASKNYYEQLSLYVCRETAHCARLSCGGVIQACISVCKGEVRNAFAIVRPPGHHAEPDEHMGFCFFNNVAVAAKEVQRLSLAKKVLILDWDVHHGNGTQRAFYNDPDVLYISIHRHDGGKFYPSSDFGALDMVGEGAGKGKSVNIPWPGAGHGDADYLYAFQKIVMPIAYEFAPDLVIISAGFDAAEGDTLGGCLVTPPAYGHMTHMLCAVAGGKVVVALEGGYNLQAISDSALAVGQVLLGEPPAELPALQASEVATEVIHQVAKIQSEHWESIDVKACEPPEVADTDEFTVRTPIPDILKAHRAHHLFHNHRLFQIPLASEALEESFGGQVTCSEHVCDVKPEDVLVLFVHDFGNLRVETDGVKSTNVKLTSSYLLDTSTAVINWINERGYQIIDVNILAALPTTMVRGTKNIINRAPKKQQALMHYIWDNYVELSESDNVVFIGHGTGCSAIMDLINTRAVESRVKAVVQVAGLHSMVRIDPHNETLGQWFRSSSQVFLPKSHPILDDDRARRRIGAQLSIAEDSEKVVDVLNAALPQIKAFVAGKVGDKTSTPSAEVGLDAGANVNGHNGSGSNGTASLETSAGGAGSGARSSGLNGSGTASASDEQLADGMVMDIDGPENGGEVLKEVEVVQVTEVVTTETVIPDGEDQIMA